MVVEKTSSQEQNLKKTESLKPRHAMPFIEFWYFVEDVLYGASIN